jgi:hypothetical protein
VKPLIVADGMAEPTISSVPPLEKTMLPLATPVPSTAVPPLITTVPPLRVVPLAMPPLSTRRGSGGTPGSNASCATPRGYREAGGGPVTYAMKQNAAGTQPRLLKRPGRFALSAALVPSRRRFCSDDRACRRHPGLELKAHPHMLRHACGHALANKGHDTRAIQGWLGH